MKLWAFGRYALKLSETEFGRLTIAEYNALLEQYQKEQERLDYRAALICAVMANAFRSPGKRAFKPKDFMPEYKSAKQVRQTPEQMFEMVKSIHARYVKDDRNK